jgi:hypothetical protein
MTTNSIHSRYIHWGGFPHFSDKAIYIFQLQAFLHLMVPTQKRKSSSTAHSCWAMKVGDGATVQGWFRTSGAFMGSKPMVSRGGWSANGGFSTVLDYRKVMTGVQYSMDWLIRLVSASNTYCSHAPKLWFSNFYIWHPALPSVSSSVAPLGGKPKNDS